MKINDVFLRVMARKLDGEYVEGGLFTRKGVFFHSRKYWGGGVASIKVYNDGTIRIGNGTADRRVRTSTVSFEPEEIPWIRKTLAEIYDYLNENYFGDELEEDED